MATKILPADLWSVIRRSTTVDPADLLEAVIAECEATDPDPRTRVLIRDSLRALSARWGESTLAGRLSKGVQDLRTTLEQEDFGDRGFPTLMRRLMERTTPESILSVLRELGDATQERSSIVVGGSTALILRGLLLRATDDIDAVDEIPGALRTQYQLLDSLVVRYGLRLAHFQSHYLPFGWKNRVSSFGVFGQLTVFLVDPVDIFVGKVFSKRVKDLDDLRMIRRVLDWPTILDRLQTTAAPLRAIPSALEAATHNWYILTGDPLPAAV
jgi:hypothetical protein